MCGSSGRHSWLLVGGFDAVGFFGRERYTCNLNIRSTHLLASHTVLVLFGSVFIVGHIITASSDSRKQAAV